MNKLFFKFKLKNIYIQFKLDKTEERKKKKEKREYPCFKNLQ